jgi:hypothetical protein
MKHQISTTVINQPLGQPQSDDGIAMLFVQFKAIAGTDTTKAFNLNTAYLLTGMNDVASYGITAALDITNGTALYQQLSEFYSEAGEGALLWLVGVNMTANNNEFATANTPLPAYIGSTTCTNLIKYTGNKDFTQRAKLIGFCYALPTASQVAADFPADVSASLTAMQTLRATLFNQGYQINFIVDGYNMSATVTPATLGNVGEDSYPNGSLCITGSQPNGISGVGAALGRFAKISIGHGFNNVQDGSISLTSAYLTNGNLIQLTPKSVADAPIIEGVKYIVNVGTITYNSIDYSVGETFIGIADITTFTTSHSGTVNAVATPVGGLYPGDINVSVAALVYPDDFDLLGEKQYMFLRTWEGHSGFYWNDGATCSDPTTPESTQEFGRVANSLSASVRAFIIDNVGQNAIIDTKTGNVDQNYCNTLQQKFYDEYIVPLKVVGGTGDITDGSLKLSGTPNGNQIQWNFILTIVASPLVGGATGTVVFSYTL